MCSSVSRDAATCVRIDGVSTSCSIQTRAATAFVNVYKNNVTFRKMWKKSKLKHNAHISVSLHEEWIQLLPNEDRRAHSRRSTLENYHDIYTLRQF